MTAALTETQQRFAERVREVLQRFRVSFSEGIEGNRGEAWYTFRIDTDPKTGPDVRVQIVDDAFVVSANTASLYRDRTAWDQDSPRWIADSLDVLERLLENPLKIRVRRTWLGRTTGAIWIPAKNDHGGWSGDRSACLGKGHELTFPSSWYHTTAK